MVAVIEATRLTKSYGSHRGIVDVDLAVEPGEVFGFLGPNGAGKTTTIRTMLDLIRPTAGVVRVFGIESSVDPVAIHRRVGYIPGEFALYDRLTGAQTIEYFANLRGGVDPAYQAELIERLDLDPSRRYKEYSKGNKQKVGHRRRAPASPGAAGPGRADIGPGPARPAGLLRARARGERRPAAPCSCRPTSCPRSRRPATGWPSSATGGWSRRHRRGAAGPRPSPGGAAIHRGRCRPRRSQDLPGVSDVVADGHVLRHARHGRHHARRACRCRATTCSTS